MIPRLHKSTSIHDPSKTISAGIASAATKATDFITSITDGGIFVHPETDATSGVRITDVIDIIRTGISRLQIAADGIRIGLATSAHVNVTPDSLKFQYGSVGDIVPLEITNRYVRWDAISGGENITVTSLPRTVTLLFPSSAQEMYMWYSVGAPQDSASVFVQGEEVEDIDYLSGRHPRNRVDYNSAYYSYDESTHVLTLLDSTYTRSLLSQYGTIYIPIVEVMYRLKDDYPDTFLMQMKIAGRTAYPTFVYSAFPTDANSAKDESQLPVTPCFVLDASDGAFYFCDGT